MKIKVDNINAVCLPYMKRPKRIIGAKAVLLEDTRNNRGQMIEALEVVEVFQSFRGYGVKVEKDGITIIITRISRYNVRFLKDGTKD